MTPREFGALWKVYLGSEERQSIRIAWLFTQYANAHRDTSKRSNPFTVEDFIQIQYNRTGARAEPIIQTPEDTVDFLKMMGRAIRARNEAIDGRSK